MPSDVYYIYGSTILQSVIHLHEREMCRKLLERPIREFYFICGSPVLPRNFRMRVTARDELASSDSEDSGPDDDLYSVTVQGTRLNRISIYDVACQKYDEGKYPQKYGAYHLVADLIPNSHQPSVS